MAGQHVFAATFSELLAARLEMYTRMCGLSVPQNIFLKLFYPRDTVDLHHFSSYSCVKTGRDATSSTKPRGLVQTPKAMP